MKGSKMIKRFCVGAVVALTLGACGGGGGGGNTAVMTGTALDFSNMAMIGDTGTILPTHAMHTAGGAITTAGVFTPSTNTGSNLLKLELDAAATTANELVFNLRLDTVDLTLDLVNNKVGVSADMSYDSSWMTFTSIMPNGANAAVTAASPDQGDANSLVIGITEVTENIVAVLKFAI